MATATEGSLYEQCSQVIREDFSRKAEPFTEIDVVNRVAKRGWGEQQYNRALNEAQQICATLFRSSRLKRYGPVQPPSQSQPDFLRRGRGGKILYVGFDATRPLKTPNGIFPPLAYADARKLGLVRPGRSAGIDRDDFQLWGEQLIKRTKDTEVLAPPNGNSSEVTRLKANLSAANDDNAAKDREITRLRSLLTERSEKTILVEIPVTDDLIDQMVEALLPRLDGALHSKGGA